MITYAPLHDTDLSKLPPFEPKPQWKKLKPPQHSSLAAVAYKMARGDEIYVKEGASIVGRGLILCRYKFDQGILKRPDVNWGHYVKVDWTGAVPKGQIRFVGPSQNTVYRLTREEVSILKHQFSTALKKQRNRQSEVLEGRIKSCQRQTRLRDRGIIEAKKQSSDYRCELCHLVFEEVYGKIGRYYIVVHHLKPIGARKRASRTRLDELLLVCQNCHAMLHRRNPPIAPDEMRRFLARAKRVGTLNQELCPT